MKPDEAARRLQETLPIPMSKGCVLVWHATPQDPPSLKIWADSHYLNVISKSTPKEYEGFKVEVESLPSAFTYAS